MGIPDHLTCFLRNMYADQEATVRTGHGTTDWFQIGKGVSQGWILSPCLFNFYAELLGWKKHKVESRLWGEISVTSDTQIDTTLMAEREEPLDESEKGEWKVGLKLNIQNTSWQIDGETVGDFILGGSTITADGDHSHKIKRHLLLGRKVMTNLDRILKSRDITLPTKVR